jgi:hypothetical protein
MALFGHGGEVATDATKGSRTRLTPKGPRDFLLNFHHAQILFGTIVGKWYSEIAHEPQDAGSIALKAVEQVLGLGLFDSPSLLGHGERGRLGSQAILDELMVGGREPVKHRRGQTVCPACTSLFYRVMAQQQMVFEVACPLLLLLFMQKAQIAKMVSITEGMFTLGVLGITTVAIMDHRPMKLRQDADRIGGCLASLAVRGLMGQGLGTDRMQPM